MEATENYPVMDSEVLVTTTCSMLGMVEPASTSPIAPMSVATGVSNSSRSLNPKSGLVKSAKGWLGQTKDLKKD